MIALIIITLVIVVVLLGVSIFVAKMVARMDVMEHEYFDGRPDNKSSCHRNRILR